MTDMSKFLPKKGFKMINILDVLSSRYNKATLTKDELAIELGVSLSTIDKALSKGNVLPQHIRVGIGKKSSIRFSIVAVANYITNNIDTGVEL